MVLVAGAEGVGAHDGGVGAVVDTEFVAGLGLGTEGL